MVSTSRRQAWTRWLLATFLAYLALRSGCSLYRWSHRESTLKRLNEGEYQVLQVFSGMELWIAPRTSSAHPSSNRVPDERARVRLAGIRPAESAEVVAAARKYTMDFTAGETVQVRLGRRQMDTDGTLVAFLSVDGEMLNVELVRAGLAMSDPQPGDSPTLIRQIEAAEVTARQSGCGCWAVRPRVQRPEDH